MSLLIKKMYLYRTLFTGDEFGSEFDLLLFISSLPLGKEGESDLFAMSSFPVTILYDFLLKQSLYTVTIGHSYLTSFCGIGPKLHGDYH